MKKVMFLIVGILLSHGVSAATMNFNGEESNQYSIGIQQYVAASENTQDVEFDFSVTGGSIEVGSSTLLEILASDFDVASVRLSGGDIVGSIDYISDEGAFVETWSLLLPIVLVAGDYVITTIISSTSGGNLAANVSAVPIPAALWLFAPALVGFFGFRRKAAVAA